MAEKDLMSVFAIDEYAFSPEWQLGFQNLRACFMGTNDSFVAEYDGELIAFLMSDRFFNNQHVSRRRSSEHHGKRLGPFIGKHHD